MKIFVDVASFALQRSSRQDWAKARNSAVQLFDFCSTADEAGASHISPRFVTNSIGYGILNTSSRV
jgi:hypothetical protein